MQILVNTISFLGDGKALHRCCSLYLKGKGRIITDYIHGLYVMPVLWLGKDWRGNEHEHHPLPRPLYGHLMVMELLAASKLEQHRNWSQVPRLRSQGCALAPPLLLRQLLLHRAPEVSHVYPVLGWKSLLGLAADGAANTIELPHGSCRIRHRASRWEVDWWEIQFRNFILDVPYSSEMSCRAHAVCYCFLNVLTMEAYNALGRASA